jgi:hypothetical protein
MKLMRFRILIAASLLMPVGALAQSSGGSAGGSSSGGAAGSGNAAGLAHSGNDPSGSGKSAKMPPAPGTNTLGTANSSGGSSRGRDSSASNGDKAVDAENKLLDKKIKAICKGC